MWHAQCLLSQVAIKSIRKERITDNLDRIHIQREIEITASLRHSNIIRFYEGQSENTTQVSNIIVNYYLVSSPDRFLDSECFKESYCTWGKRYADLIYNQWLTVQSCSAVKLKWVSYPFNALVSSPTMPMKDNASNSLYFSYKQILLEHQNQHWIDLNKQVYPICLICPKPNIASSSVS